MKDFSIFFEIREALADIFDCWGDDIKDEDVSDLSKYRLKDYINRYNYFQLYRYMPANYFNIRNIETQNLHLSPNGVMNDVFEGIPEYSDANLTYLDFEKLNDLAYMTCFSESNKNLLMWSHYAEKHKGFCVEYDLKRLDSNDKVIEHLYPVLYKEKRQYKRDIKSLIESLEDLNNAIQYNDEYDGELELNDILPLFLTKGLDWEYEKEWRIIYTKKEMYDLDDSKLYSCNIPFHCISAVYLGYRINPEVKKHIKEICKRISTDSSKISVFQAKLSPSSYELEYELCSDVE